MKRYTNIIIKISLIVIFFMPVSSLLRADSSSYSLDENDSLYRYNALENKNSFISMVEYKDTGTKQVSETSIEAVSGKDTSVAAPQEQNISVQGGENIAVHVKENKNQLKAFFTWLVSVL
ncbi:MAG TPA: hypothetical protein VGO21_04930 [Candidatus Paceibacterota bacterium]|jgi:hypothetical protein|nr:hypothetical protein [Candidatus Paceibacterota bacterium]